MGSEAPEGVSSRIDLPPAGEKKRTRPKWPSPWLFSWWPLPELNWGHEDFQSTPNGVSALCAGPCCYVLVGKSGDRKLALYALVAGVYWCLLYKNYTPHPHPTPGESQSGFDVRIPRPQVGGVPSPQEMIFTTCRFPDLTGEGDNHPVEHGCSSLVDIQSEIICGTLRVIEGCTSGR